MIIVFLFCPAYRLLSCARFSKSRLTSDIYLIPFYRNRFVPVTFFIFTCCVVFSHPIHTFSLFPHHPHPQPKLHHDSPIALTLRPGTISSLVHFDHFWLWLCLTGVSLSFVSRIGNVQSFIPFLFPLRCKSLLYVCSFTQQ